MLDSTAVDGHPLAVNRHLLQAALQAALPVPQTPLLVRIAHVGSPVLYVKWLLIIFQNGLRMLKSSHRLLVCWAQANLASSQLPSQTPNPQLPDAGNSNFVSAPSLSLPSRHQTCFLHRHVLPAPHHPDMHAGGQGLHRRRSTQIQWTA